MSDRPVQSADRLSDFESLLWRLERDPQLASGFANISFLDRPADVDRLRHRMARAAALIPQLRRRILTDPIELAPPRWIDDPEFSIERHVRAESISSTTDRAAIASAAMAFCHRSYDPDHPLWEFLLLDDGAGGPGVMLQRFHHTIADGVGMMRMSEQFIDIERDAVPPDPISIPRAEPMPSRIHASRDAIGHSLGRTVDSVRSGLEAGTRVVQNPASLRDGARATIEATRAITAELAAMGHRRSPLWTARSTDRTLLLMQRPFEPIRETARRLGVTVNDLFVAAVASGAGSYHRLAGAPVEQLRMAMPVNTRSDRSAGGNAFGMARVLVPTRVDTTDNLAEIHRNLGGVRSSAGVSMMQHLAGIAGLLPTPLLIQLTRSQVSAVDFTTSNVRGAPFTVYLAGARVEANHPIGPLAGTAFNLTMLSYNGALDMGLHVDTAAVEAPDLLGSCIDDAFDTLLER
ncbi:MAG: DUF1298 domain-containing protein [Actinobacteria bacterium]|nr:DUF1298 domain-containing protein [Actinomycetota bacterium]